MKAPNTTQKLCYLQSLRNRLPENTPIYVVLMKRTPSEQEEVLLVVFYLMYVRCWMPRT
jgi:hypothetical protein